MGRKKPTERDPAGVVAAGKSKKKVFSIADDEYSMGIDLPEEKVAPAVSEKKGKKGVSEKLELKEEDEDVRDNEFAMLHEDEESKDNQERSPTEEEGDVGIPFTESDQEEETKTKKQENEDTSKNKKKKKGVKTAQEEEEEEDLDKILAEIGAIPPESKNLPTYVETQVVPPPDEKEEDGPMESVASKNKKKKQKQKEKKAEEKQKEANTKQEGKLLTKKQKEEASGAPYKRPVYQKKKLKPQGQSNVVATLDSAEGADIFEDVASSCPKDKIDASDVVQDNAVHEEGDDEWDAKSWDDADLKLPGKTAFVDEEVDSEPEHLFKKEMMTATQDVEIPSVAKLARSENSNKIHVNREKNKKVQKFDDHPTQNGQNLRSPICCIMGHVDAGKTKLLDCIRGTNVQEGEAGGITQQIGATYFPAKNIRERTSELKADAKLNVPGLLVIDTPGHESFTNLRSRGSGLCDIAILVVDIMHGLEPQTIESLNLLKMRNTDFIVALNKVDRLYGWKGCPNAPIRKALSQQTRDVEILFNYGLKKVKNQFQEQGLNTELYYKNKEMVSTTPGDRTFNIVPTSAIHGEGIPDLLLVLVKWTEKMMVERLTYSDEVQCTVLEVKVVEGHGTTVDVVLVNGVLREGDQIVVCSMQGPIVTTIRALLTPHPMKELRVKGTYLHHKEIKAAMCIKITGQGLEHAIAGTSLHVVGPHDDLKAIKKSAMEDIESVMSRIDTSGDGVYVQASTLGSLEALLEFLKTPAVNIPVSGISIGPVHKKDVMKASVMLRKKKEYGTILAFDVKVTQEAREEADELGVKIFTADIIYHLFDQFKAYMDSLKEAEKKKEVAEDAVFPCVLKIMPNCVFNKKDPILLGVDVVEGIVKIGTPICVPQREFIEIGRISSIKNNDRLVDSAKKGQKVAIKIVSKSEEQQKMFGRHFDYEDELVSKISRSSLDALKEKHAGDISLQEKRLLFKLKKIFNIP